MEGYSLLLYLLIIPPVILFMMALTTVHLHARDDGRLASLRRSVRYRDSRMRGARFRLDIWCTTGRPTPRWRLRPRDWTDGLVEMLGLGPSEAVGDASFDRRWTLECDHPAIRDLFQREPELCELLNRMADNLSLPALRIRHIASNGRKVQISLKCSIPVPGSSNEELAQICAEALIKICETLAQGTQPRRDSHLGLGTYLSSGIPWFHWVLAAIGYYGLLRSSQGPFLLEPMRMFVDTLWISIPIAFGLMLCLLLTHARSSQLGSLLRHGLLVGLPGVVLATHTVARELNLRGDETLKETVHYPAVFDGQRDTLGKGHSAWVRLTEPLSANSPAREVKLKYEVAAAMGLGWPPRERAICVRLRWGEGGLGYPWVKVIQSIPDRRSLLGETTHPCEALTRP